MPSFEKHSPYVHLYQWELYCHVLLSCCLISFCFCLRNSLRISCKAGLVAMSSHSFRFSESLYLISEAQLCWVKHSLGWPGSFNFVLFVHLVAVVAFVLWAYHCTLSCPTRLLLRNTRTVLCMWQAILLFLLSKSSLLLTFGNMDTVHPHKDLSICNLSGATGASWIQSSSSALGLESLLSLFLWVNFPVLSPPLQFLDSHILKWFLGGVP